MSSNNRSSGRRSSRPPRSRSRKKSARHQPPKKRHRHSPPHHSSKPRPRPAPPADDPDWQPPSIPKQADKTQFIDLDLPQSVLRAICDLGFEYCTPIQEISLKHTLAGKDLGGRAQTGTGKTAAFLITAFSQMRRNPLEEQASGTPRALVLAPTRELAIQIHKDSEALAKYSGANCVAVFGGMDYKKQQVELAEQVDVLVATPGRLIDYMRQRIIDLSNVEMLIIDEADRMLDMGFIPDVRRIVSRCPKTGDRQTLMWSATLTPTILELADKWLKDPIMLEVEEEEVVGKLIDQIFYTVTEEQKLPLLFWHLEHDDVARMLIFTNRKDRSNRLHDQLSRRGVECALLTGDVPQRKRLRVLEGFRSGKTPVIIATDVAARGIHVDNISHVVNYDLPFETEDYVHRVGRTGRAGETGKAISFADEYGSYIIPELEEYIEDEIRSERPPEEMVEFDLPDATRPARKSRSKGRGRGGQGGGRRGGGRGRGNRRGGGSRRR